MVITFYILFFVPEKNKVLKTSKGDVEADASTDSDSEEEELTILPSQIFSILGDILSNENLKIYILFLITTCACYSIDSNVSQVYMTNELKFSRESLSLMKIVSAPANIICAIVSSYLSSERPFRFFFQITIFCMCLSCYSILVLLRNFPTNPIE